MMKLFVFFLGVWSFLYSYDRADLDWLWSSVSDVNNPTLEDYRLIEHGLSQQALYQNILPDSVFASHAVRVSCLRKLNATLNLKLIGPNDEMPIFEKYSFNIDENSNDQCILLYSSYNGIYPEKARKILLELERTGYRGHVLLRIGGFPNTPNGGLKICHVPYAFKVAFLCEARSLGYKRVLWIDTAIHPLTDLAKIFMQIKRKGYFFITVGSLQDNCPNHLYTAAKSLNILTEFYDQIPHIASSVMGLNMENNQAVQFLEGWLKETERVFPNITCFPEELSLSVVAWRLNCKPMTWFGNIVCLENEVTQLEDRPYIQFYLDDRR